MTASGKRDNETARLSGELLIGDDFLVARLGLGTMRLTGKGIWGEPADRHEAMRVVRRAVELGVNFIDTADSYGPAVTEAIIAAWVTPNDAENILPRTSARPMVVNDSIVCDNAQTW